MTPSSENFGGEEEDSYAWDTEDNDVDSNFDLIHDDQDVIEPSSTGKPGRARDDSEPALWATTDGRRYGKHIRAALEQKHEERAAEAATARRVGGTRLRRDGDNRRNEQGDNGRTIVEKSLRKRSDPGKARINISTGQFLGATPPKSAHAQFIAQLLEFKYAKNGTALLRFEVPYQERKNVESLRDLFELSILIDVSYNE